jgi:hypothetical protein
LSHPLLIDSPPKKISLYRYTIYTVPLRQPDLFRPLPTPYKTAMVKGPQQDRNCDQEGGLCSGEVKQLAKMRGEKRGEKTVPSNKRLFCERCRCSPSLLFAESISKEFYACEINNK